MRTLRFFRISAACQAMILLSATPSQADISNTATATGTPTRGFLNPVQDTSTVLLEAFTRRMSVAKEIVSVSEINGYNPSIVDAGDIITFRIVIQNTGTLPLTSVIPNDPGPTFDGVPGTGQLSEFEFDQFNSTARSPNRVLSGESAVFIVRYTMSALDALRAARSPNAIRNTTSGFAAESPETDTAIVTYDIPASPQLVVENNATLEERYGVNDGTAAIGDIITYRYIVTNTGNVAVNDVKINDIHEGGEQHAQMFDSVMSMRNERLIQDGPLRIEAPSIDRMQDGSWDVLQPGASIQFVYTHTVTEAEFMSR